MESSADVGPERALGTLEQRVMTEAWIEPYGDHGLSVPSLSHNLTVSDTDSLTRILQRWERKGLVEQDGKLKTSGETVFWPTPKLWAERELLLHRLSWRHPALRNQANADVADLVLALLMAHKIRDERMKGGWHSSRPALRPRAELSVYLFKRTSGEIDAACDRLVEKGWVKADSFSYKNASLPAVEPTVPGVVAYREKVAAELGLAPRKPILDLTKKSEIVIFWAWQADFKPARNEIKKALESVVQAINRGRKSILPLRIETAVDVGDGAVRIDSTLLDKIAAADAVAADVTPVYRAFRRLNPNPNVLVEVGYALAHKAPEQVLLMEKKREPGDVPGDDKAATQLPFDISTVHRIAFDSSTDLRQRLLAELVALLEKKSWARSNGNGVGDPGEKRSTRE